MTDRTPAIFVVDDDPSVRTAIERLLRASGFAVTSYASAGEYLEHYDPDAPGCLLLDLAMPKLSGLDLQDVLVARGGAPPIVFLTGHGQVPDSVRAMKQGAVDFLSKPVDEPTLLAAVKSAMEIDRVERAARAELADIRRRLATLTPREAEVLQHVVAGLLNKQTAAALGTVEKTVKVHRARVMEKMQVKSLSELIQLAVRAGIVSKPAS